MSKMDDMRAMREARFGQAPPRPIRAPRAPVAPKVVSRPPVEDDTAEPEERLCGHRAISGRTCTREHGHDAKSHRYS